MPRKPAPSNPSPAKNTDNQLTTELVEWFANNRRDLPWRRLVRGRRNPYHALVAEFMLQQTQVSRVIERFELFIDRFPTLQDLAEAPLDDVLALWSGLGYYRRARSLHAAAVSIAQTHNAHVPSDTAALEALPGVGRYTAGAISSIAFNKPAPIVDGNVSRVLLRLHAKAETPNAPETVNWCWDRATYLVQAANDPGAFNEGLMELGATVCTPKNPRCLYCPLADRCDSLAQGRQDEIPLPKPSARQRELFAAVALCTDAKRRLLVERRPDTGLWAGLWQAPTIERDDRPTRPAELAEALSLTISSPTPIATFTHVTTHRLVRFEVYDANAPSKQSPPRSWRTPTQLADLALSSPQRRILLPVAKPTSPIS